MGKQPRETALPPVGYRYSDALGRFVVGVPTTYISADSWALLTPEQREAAGPLYTTEYEPASSPAEE